VTLFATIGSKKQVSVQRSGRVFVEQKHKLAPYKRTKRVCHIEGLNVVNDEE